MERVLQLLYTARMILISTDGIFFRLHELSEKYNPHQRGSRRSEEEEAISHAVKALLNISLEAPTQEIAAKKKMNFHFCKLVNYACTVYGMQYLFYFSNGGGSYLEEF